MTILNESRLRFITPAFIAGANQSEPEIRVPSIRGELRWWFRAVGGTLADEAKVFGGVHDGAAASAVVIRVSDMKIVNGKEITAPQNTPRGYLYYFATVSGNAKGTRTAAGHYLNVGTTFKMTVLLRSSLEPHHAKLLNDALGMFLRYGTLGLRSTRGCGAFTAEGELPFVDEKIGEKFTIGKISRESFDTGLKCQTCLGSFLQDFRRDLRLSGKEKTALGYSIGKERFSSALKLRPVETAPGRFEPYIVYSDAASRERSIEDLVRNRLIVGS